MQFRDINTHKRSKENGTERDEMERGPEKTKLRDESN
jgi:hypothetical protein